MVDRPWGLLLSPGVRGGLLREAVLELRSDEEKAGLAGARREHSSESSNLRDPK